MYKVHGPEESLTKRQRPNHGIINVSPPCTPYNPITKGQFTGVSFSKHIMSGFQHILQGILKGNEHRWKMQCKQALKLDSDMAGKLELSD